MDEIRSWSEFVNTSRKAFDAQQGSLAFQLIETLDELYRVGYARGPFPAPRGEPENFLHMCFLICRRALLSAATSTGSGFPEDSPAATRRALEAAKACFAIKADPANFERWKNIRLRKNRWESRGRPTFKGGAVDPKYTGVFGKPLYDNLKSTMGALSDFAVHFTPEHLLGYVWEHRQNPDGSIDTVFTIRQEAVRNEFLMLAGHHRLIFHVFDHCLDDQLLATAEVQSVAQQAMKQYASLLHQEGYIQKAADAGERW
jgi:hypothetical protein